MRQVEYDVNATHVRESWLRCEAVGLDPDSDPPVDLIALEEVRSRHPLAAVMPVVRSLLVEHASDEGLLVAVTDAGGRLLWVEGAPAALRKAERIHFTGGARWDERTAGTNAPALALALDAPVQVKNSQHWAHRVQRWSCSAAPLHDPFSGELLGALDVTGDGRAASSGALALVKATVAAVERELLVARLQPARRSRDASSAARLHLQLLGPQACELRVDGAPRHISLRHAELLVLLSAHPEGLTAEQLGCQLDERDLDPVTVRAEMSRLRRVIGIEALATRPYRLAVPLVTDVDAVRTSLDAGRVAVALQGYAGPLLSRSEAPGVIRLREALAAEVRAAVLGGDDPSLVLQWAETAWGVEDPGVWSRAHDLLPDGIARQRVAARRQLLEQRAAG